MATAFRRKSDNKVVVLLTHLTDINNINFTSTNMSCTMNNGEKQITFNDVNTNDFERVDDITPPTSFFGNAMTYIDGTWAVDNTYVTLVNNQRARMNIEEQIERDEFSEKFISEVLEIIRNRNISVVPTAAIITKFIRKNRKYKSLLPVGIRI